MNSFLAAVLGSLGVVVFYGVSFFALAIFAEVVIGDFVSRAASYRFFDLGSAAFGFWPEMAALIQLFLATPLLAAGGALLSWGALRLVLSTASWSTGDQALFSFLITLLFVRVVYAFWRF